MSASRSDKPRGACPICGRSTVLLNDGRVGRHGGGPKGVWPPQLCPGWGKPAATT